MRAGRSSSSALLKVMCCRRSTGRLPGRLASSIRSWSAAVKAGATSVSSGSAVGADGWLMFTWPVTELPSAKPAEM